MQHHEIDHRRWFRDTGYEQWVKRVQRLIKLHRETTLSKNELRELQRFILEFGHFNANFTLAELETLLYPKSPTANMAVHSYLRSHQTIAAEVLRHHFFVDHNIVEADNLYPLFIDSAALWEDAKHFCYMINADDDFHQKPDITILPLITSTDSSQSDIWVLLPATVDSAIDNYLKARKAIREFRLSHLINNVVPENLRDCFKSNKGRVFSDELYQLLNQFIRKELAQISEESEKNKHEETAYDKKNTKEKIKWSAAKFGLLKKHGALFLEAKKIKTPGDLSKFVEDNANLNLIIRMTDELEEKNESPEEKQRIFALIRAAHYGQAIDRWIKNQFALFNDNIYFIVPHLEYQHIDTMIIVGQPESFSSDFAGPKKIVNRLGYRAESSKLIYALLNIYPGLFVNKQETRFFWDVLMSVGLIDKLPDAEKQIITRLPAKIEEKLVDKNTKTHLAKLVTNLKEAKCAECHEIYQQVMMSMVTRLTNRETKGRNPITEIIALELVDHLFLFTNAITRKDDFSFAQAIRALQSAGELLKLDLATASQSSMPSSISTIIKKKLLKAYSVQEVVVSAYAMRSYLHVIGSCMAGNQGKKLRLAVTNQNYFESLLSLKSMRSSSIELNLVNNLYTDRFQADVVITELDPNSATDKRLFQQNLKGLIDKLAQHYQHSDMRITLVIDTTLNSVNHHEITDMLDRARGLIDSGAINIIILQSLTKFSQVGLDQCNAGLSIVINNGVDWKDHNKHYKDLTESNITDRVSQRYFDFFANLMSGSNMRALSDHYVERIVQSTNSFYAALLKYAPNLGSSNDNLFKMVQTTEYHLCYVAFNTAGILAAVDPQSRLVTHDLEAFNNHLKDHLIIPICREFQMPLTCRQSIGFPLSSVTVALDSLRFTVGDESLPTIVRYASIISYIIQYLNQHSDLASLFHKDKDGKYTKRIQDLQEAARQFRQTIDKNSLLKLPVCDSILYGPFEQKNDKLYIARTGNQVFVYYQNRIIPIDNIAIYQYGCVTHLMKMTHDQLDFIFCSTAYKITAVDPALMKVFQPTLKSKQIKLDKQYTPLIKDSLKFIVLELGSPSNWVCQIIYDELVAAQNCVNVYQRAFSPGLYSVDIDHWGEKDSINARFLNLCIALYVKQRYNCDFKVRGIPNRDTSMDQRFLFSSHYDFDTLGGAFQEAVNMVEIHRGALLAFRERHRQRLPTVNARPFSFSRQTHPTLHANSTHYYNGPNSYPDISFIEEIFHILMISDRYEMLLENNERKGIFSEPKKTTNANQLIKSVTFFSPEVQPTHGESKNDRLVVWGKGSGLDK